MNEQTLMDTAEALAFRFACRGDCSAALEVTP